MKKRENIQLNSILLNPSNEPIAQNKTRKRDTHQTSENNKYLLETFWAIGQCRFSVYFDWSKSSQQRFIQISSTQ